jgi:hypothetical protein
MLKLVGETLFKTIEEKENMIMPTVKEGLGRQCSSSVKVPPRQSSLPVNVPYFLKILKIRNIDG